MTKHPLFDTMRHMIFRLLLLFFILMNYSVISAKNVDVIENEFIKIVVNAQDDDKGRFAVESTIGDPARTSDDNQPLIYGRPIPWTSYTTFIINDKTYIFGGKSSRLKRRSTAEYIYGDILDQKVIGNTIETRVLFEDTIEVLQTLQLVRNESTGVKDTALITYALTNKGAVSQNINARILLDAKLGSNDAAPFRVSDKAIQTEQELSKNDLIEFWQTFDSLSSPNVIAQGTLKDDRFSVSPPDKIILANWGTLYENPFNVDVVEGRSFTRTGELEADTALAMYWNDISVSPNATVRLSTMYGLGGISLAAGEMSIGLTAPATILSTRKDSILMMVYIANMGGFDSQNTMLKLDFPKGFILENMASSQVNIGVLKAGEVKQIPIRVRVKKPKTGKANLRVSVGSSTLEDNVLNKEIEIVGPPALVIRASFDRSEIDPYSPYIPVSLLVKNPSIYPIYNIRASIKNSDAVADFDIVKKQVSALRPNGSVIFNWLLKHNGLESIDFLIDSDVTPIQKRKVALPESGQKPGLKTALESRNNFYTLSIPVYTFLTAETNNQFEIHYPNNQFKRLRVRPSKSLIKHSQIAVDDATGKVTVSLNAKPTQFDFYRVYLKRTATANASAQIRVMQNAEVIEEIEIQ